jgi:hypothetical protein
MTDQSADTVVVARQVKLHEGLNLDLNYEGTSVPVPNSVDPSGVGVVLSQYEQQGRWDVRFDTLALQKRIDSNPPNPVVARTDGSRPNPVA